MPIETEFSFAQGPLGQAMTQGVAVDAKPVDLLGHLRAFVGPAAAGKAQRTWKGTGFTMIWRPSFPTQPDAPDFFLQLMMTTETLTFTDITGSGIANRGLLQPDILLGGVAYLQTVEDSFDETGQHFEPGVFANIPQTTNPDEPATVTRMGSIPHGTTVNMQGTAFEAPEPRFATSSITPFRIGSADDGQTGLVHFNEEDLSKPSTARTDLARVAGLTQALLSNPNLFLSQALAGQTIKRMTVIDVFSETNAGTTPDVGGGTDNIAFLVGKGAPPAGGPNADAARASSTFWVEEVTDAAGETFFQLQYTQRVLLNFSGLSWPHVSVATLRLVDTPPATS